MTKAVSAREVIDLAIYESALVQSEKAIGMLRDEIAAALHDAGYVIVPKEPSEKMYAAANREWDGRMSARTCGVWQAMLAASQEN